MCINNYPHTNQTEHLMEQINQFKMKTFNSNHFLEVLCVEIFSTLRSHCSLCSSSSTYPYSAAIKTRVIEPRTYWIPQRQYRQQRHCQGISDCILPRAFRSLFRDIQHLFLKYLMKSVSQQPINRPEISLTCQSNFLKEICVKVQINDIYLSITSNQTQSILCPF